jgi:hypothetical protein
MKTQITFTNQVEMLTVSPPHGTSARSADLSGRDFS